MTEAGSRRAILYLLMIVGLILGAAKFNTPSSPEPSPDLGAQEETPWQLSTARESMATGLEVLTHLSQEEAYEIVLLVEQESAKYDLDPFRVLALLIAESHGDVRAVSDAGALGLMQIMPQTGKFIAESLGQSWKGDASLFDAGTNIIYGVWYYHHLLQLFRGNEQAALVAYNWGPEHIRDRIRKGEKLPTIYSSKILAAEASLEREFSNAATSHFREYLGKNNYLAVGEDRSSRSGSSDPDRRLPGDAGEGS